jgi:glyoxylase-like metal-dependent hydrolase (beta-lactamase superfamily II)/ferredoxin
LASRDERLPTNASGDFFVDATCIDCDTCRWLAPATFDRAGEHSRVHTQPADPAAVLVAERALLACPTGSIGTETRHDLGPARQAFPLAIADDVPDVFHCGWHAESSFGAASYLVTRPQDRGGNVLIDSPRWNRTLAERIEALGGVTTLFLTHGDDLADHARWAQHFGATRVMHAGDRKDVTIERRIAGEDPVALDDELRILPTPGHTRGSACLVYRERFLFSGDHVAYSEPRGHVHAFRSACWYSWPVQIASMERLARETFEWILPGHGRRCHFPADEMKAQMARCVAWMKAR